MENDYFVKKKKGTGYFLIAKDQLLSSIARG